MAYRTVLNIQRSLRFDVYMSESKGVEQMHEGGVERGATNRGLEDRRNHQ